MISRREMVRLVAGPLGINQDLADKVIAAYEEAIIACLDAGEPVNSRVGTFSTRIQKPRTQRHPRTGEVIQVPERVVAIWAPSKSLRQRLNP